MYSSVCLWRFSNVLGVCGSLGVFNRFRFTFCLLLLLCFLVLNGWLAHLSYSGNSSRFSIVGVLRMQEF